MGHGEHQLSPDLQRLLLVVCGNNWPTGNAGDLRLLAEDWERAGQSVQVLSANLDGGARRVHEAIEGATEQAFQAYLSQFTADDGFLDVLSRVCAALAEGLAAMAYEIDTLRYEIVLQLIWLAVQLVLDAIAAVFTFGATAAASAAAIAATRVACLTLIRKAILKIAAYVVESTILQVGFDVIAQFLVCLTSEGGFGHFSTTQIVNAAKNGAFGGLLGGGTGLLGGFLSAGLKTGIGKFAGKSFDDVDMWFRNKSGPGGWGAQTVNLFGNTAWGMTSGVVQAAGQDWIDGNAPGADLVAGTANGAFGGMQKSYHGWTNPGDKLSVSIGGELDQWMNSPWNKPSVTSTSPLPTNTALSLDTLPGSGYWDSAYWKEEVDIDDVVNPLTIEEILRG